MERSNKKIAILVSLILIFLLSLFAQSGYFKNQISLFLTTEEKNIEKKISDSINIPSLYPDFFWEELTKEESSLGDFAIYYNNYQREKDRTKWSTDSASLKGDEWTTQIEIGDAAETNRPIFSQYYEDELSPNGWVQGIEFEGFTISAISADRPGGSIWGYVKLQDGKIRAVILSWMLTEFGAQPDTPLFTCPCTETFEVFISEEVQVGTILPLDELNN
ncbi:MAG: hypothetical protein Q8P37_00390 [Candidatus Spechtbacteria bacterium]|nr:hypothetical protein [Candidatus Spechtbacteria bacterium]